MVRRFGVRVAKSNRVESAKFRMPRLESTRFGITLFECNGLSCI